MYEDPIYKEIIPFAEDWQLSELKIQNLKHKWYPKDGPEIKRLENIQADAAIEIYKIANHA